MNGLFWLKDAQTAHPEPFCPNDSPGPMIGLQRCALPGSRACQNTLSIRTSRRLNGDTTSDLPTR